MLLVAAALFAWSIRRQSRRYEEALSATQAENRRREAADESVTRRARRFGPLASSVLPLLDRLADGTADPADPAVRHAARVEERFARSLVANDPESGPAAALAVRLATQARARSLVLETDVREAVAPPGDPIALARVERALAQVIASLPIDDRDPRLTLAPENGHLVVRLVGPLPRARRRRRRSGPAVRGPGRRGPLGGVRCPVADPGDAPLRLAVVDDHELVTEGLMALATGSGADVVYAGPSTTAAIESRPQTVLLDLHLGPAAHGVADDVTRLRAAGARVLLVSAHGTVDLVREGMAAGALGFVPKSAAPAELRDAVVRVTSGRRHVSRDLAALMLRDDASVTGADPLLSLTAAGLAPASVARRLGSDEDEVLRRLDAAAAAWAAAASG